MITSQHPPLHIMTSSSNDTSMGNNESKYAVRAYQFHDFSWRLIKSFLLPHPDYIILHDYLRTLLKEDLFLQWARNNHYHLHRDRTFDSQREILSEADIHYFIETDFHYAEWEGYSFR